MGGEPNGLHHLFSFGSNGYHSDDLGHGCVLMGTVEFQHFWNALDACFESPLGRKLIYAATDAEELIITKADRFAYGRWFGRRRAEVALQHRSVIMGWGRIQPDAISHPAHDALSVGFSLAHKEHLVGRRLNVDWHQHSADAITTTFKPKDGEMTAPLPPRSPSWSGRRGTPSGTNSPEPELDVRESGFFLGEARSMFLPVDVFHHLFAVLAGRPTVAASTSGDVHVVESVDEPAVLKAIIHAACAAFERTNRPIYVQSASDWDGHFTVHFTERGWGRVEVEQSVLDGEQATVFYVESPVVPFVLGSLVGMWKRAHGKRVESTVEPYKNGWRIALSEPTVDY